MVSDAYQVTETGPVIKADVQRLAQAIAEQESGLTDMAVGSNGERGRFQFQEQLWRSITPVFFGAAHDPITATRVAVRHLQWLTKKLRPMLSNRGQPVYLIALAWKAGPQAVLHNFTTQAQRDFAHHVAKRYDEIKFP